MPAIVAPLFPEAEFSPGQIAFGAMAVLLAVAAVVLAIYALRARRVDRGGALLGPIAGLVLGGLNLLCGSALVVAGSGVLIPPDRNPWTWRSERHRFEVTLPSERWVQRENPNVLGYFVCPMPKMMAIVAETKLVETDDEFDALVKSWKRKMAEDGVTKTEVKEVRGVNPHGHAYWLFTADAEGSRGPYVFGASVTRIPDKAVVMMVEGQYRFSSRAGQMQENRAIRSLAERFLSSVK